MPPEGLASIYITAKDGVSQVISVIGDKTKALDKETQELAQKTEILNQVSKDLLVTQVKLRADLSDAKKKVKEAKKAWEELGDELSKANYDNAINEQAELEKKLLSVNTQINANKKEYREYVESLRKTSSGKSDRYSEIAGLAKSLSDKGLTKILGDSLSGALSAGLESSLGQPLASAVNSALTSAVSGFALGGLPGLAIGTVSGIISGATQIYAAQDDAFKEYYAGLYDDVNEATEEMISSGSTTAGSREQTQKAFAKRFGSADAADEYLDQVQTVAARTNYNYDEIVTYAQSLLNTYDQDKVFSVLQSLSDATAGLNLSSSDVSTMISGLSRMRTTGKTTQEYLNYFSERGVDVYTALGEALGVDKSEIAGMVTAGDIEGEFAADAILDYIDRKFGGLSEDLMSTYDAMVDNLDDIMTTLDAAAGEGYNETRKSGLEAETEAYSGALGEAMEEINRIAGENKAYLENLSEQYTREALSAVLMGAETTLFEGDQLKDLERIQTEYAAASALFSETGDRIAALDMERLKEEAEALAKAAYESSNEYSALVDSQLDQIEAIRENTAGLSAATNAYLLSQEKSKGQMATLFDSRTETYGNTAAYTQSDDFARTMESGTLWEKWGAGLGLMYGITPDEYMGSHASGLDRVPYDEYPALLHEGERVLTASEARAEDAGKNQQIIQISVTGNSFVGTGEEMADQIAEILANKLEGAAVIAVPR